MRVLSVNFTALCVNHILSMYMIHAVIVLGKSYSQSCDQEIHVKFHSSANSGQEPDFLIRRAAKKMTFTADLRKKYACL